MMRPYAGLFGNCLWVRVRVRGSSCLRYVWPIPHICVQIECAVYTVYHCMHIPTAHAELCTIIVVFHIRKQISQCVMTCAVR